MKKTSASRNSTVTYETALYITGWCLIGIILLLILLFCFRILHVDKFLPPCILYTLTGVYCPGCGGDKGDTVSAPGTSAENAYLPSPRLLYRLLWRMVHGLSQTIDRISGHRIPIGMKYHDNYLWAAIIIVAVNFILKNFFLLVLHIDLLAI